MLSTLFVVACWPSWPPPIQLRSPQPPLLISDYPPRSVPSLPVHLPWLVMPWSYLCPPGPPRLVTLPDSLAQLLPVGEWKMGGKKKQNICD